MGIQAGSLTLTKVVIWSLLGGWVVSLLRSRRRVLIDFVTVSLFVLVMALVISVWNARDIGFWLAETYRWLATAVISAFAFNTYRRGGSPLPFLIGSLLGVLGSVALAVWQVLFDDWSASFEVRGHLRAYGPLYPSEPVGYLSRIDDAALSGAV